MKRVPVGQLRLSVIERAIVDEARGATELAVFARIATVQEAQRILKRNHRSKGSRR